MIIDEEKERKISKEIYPQMFMKPLIK